MQPAAVGAQHLEAQVIDRDALAALGQPTEAREHESAHGVIVLVTEVGPEGVVEITRPGKPAETRTMATKLPNDFVLGIWVDDQEAWFATSDGLGHAILAVPPKPAKIADAK